MLVVGARTLLIAAAVGGCGRVWEASPDRSTPFTRVFSEPTPFDFSAVTFGLIAGSYGANPAPGVARFDDLNVP